MHIRSRISSPAFSTRTDGRASKTVVLTARQEGKTTSFPVREQRTRESDAPLCNQCGDQMVRLGLSVACPHCGNSHSLR